MGRVRGVKQAMMLDGGLVLTFDDGKSAFLSADLIHQAVAKADVLPEFWPNAAPPRELTYQPERKRSRRSRVRSFARTKFKGLYRFGRLRRRTN
jgi:hypothetical protein